MQDLRRDFRTALCQGDYEQAERLANNQLALEGESSYWLNEMGILLLAQGRLAESLLHLDRAAAANAHNIEAILNGAIVLADLGFYDESQTRFEAARSMEAGTEGDATAPETPLSAGIATAEVLAEKLVELSRLFQSIGHLEKAKEELFRSISIRDNASARLDLARLALKAGNAEKSLEELEIARKLAPENPEVHVVAALCHVERGRREEALDALSKAEYLDDRSRISAILRHTIGQ